MLETTIVSSIVWTQYWNVTDGWNPSGYYSALYCEQCGRAVVIITTCDASEAGRPIVLVFVCVFLSEKQKNY